MSARIDITGQRFGRLVAIEPTDKRSNGKVVWKCYCDCGNIVFVRGSHLKNSTVSCGCIHRKDIEGQIFGRLTALEQTSKKSGDSIIWKCRCKCGNIVFANGSMLRYGRINSCGCSRINDLIGQRFGRLVVLELTSNRLRRSIIWKCQCDCGNIAFVTNMQLLTRRRNSTKSCGCLQQTSRFVNGTNIDPLNVPIEMTKCLEAHYKLKKAIKQAS